MGASSIGTETVVPASFSRDFSFLPYNRRLHCSSCSVPTRPRDWKKESWAVTRQRKRNGNKSQSQQIQPKKLQTNLYERPLGHNKKTHVSIIGTVLKILSVCVALMMLGHNPRYKGNQMPPCGCCFLFLLATPLIMTIIFMILDYPLILLQYYVINPIQMILHSLLR